MTPRPRSAALFASAARRHRFAAALAAAPALRRRQDLRPGPDQPAGAVLQPDERGRQKTADEAGAKLVIFNANNDPAAQNNAIETYIAEKVDGIIVVAIDVNGIMPAVQQAADAGIPVVAVDAILPDGPQKAQIGVDNEAAGAQIGKYFLDYVKANGRQGQARHRRRAQLLHPERPPEGLRGRRQGGSGRHRSPASSTAGTSRTTRMAAAENLMTGNPDLTAIYATGEPALLGAVAAVESQGRQDRRQGLRLGPDRAGDQGHRRRLRRRRRPAGPGRHGRRGGRGA